MDSHPHTAIAQPELASAVALCHCLMMNLKAAVGPWSSVLAQEGSTSPALSTGPTKSCTQREMAERMTEPWPVWLGGESLGLRIEGSHVRF